MPFTRIFRFRPTATFDSNLKRTGQAAFEYEKVVRQPCDPSGKRMNFHDPPALEQPIHIFHGRFRSTHEAPADFCMSFSTSSNLKLTLLRMRPRPRLKNERTT